MALLIGQSLIGREVEQETSTWAPERFASLCDALAWAASGRSCPSLPSFTSRVNAKDGGIDAEWSVDIPSDGSAIPTPIIGPGWNVFQYKKRDLIAQDRRRVISNLKTSLKSAVKDIVTRSKGCPDHYILFVNVDLKHNDKQGLKDAILKGSPDQNLHVEVIGAGELAAFLNDHPHLRAAYFTEHSFKTWETAYQDHRERKRFAPFAPNVELIGREEELRRLKALVDDPYVRAIVLSGPHDVGKSRLVLEATRHRPHDTVLALGPRSLALRDYRSLYTNRGETICIVEDPEPDSIENLLNEALVAPRFKLIMLLPTAANVPAPSYGSDERVQSLLLAPLTSEDARELLRATEQPLDFEVEDWILRHAGGIPGVLLVAASAGNDIRPGRASFPEKLGYQFEEWIKKELGSDALKCARLLSALTHVGIAGKYENELRHICDLFGEGWTLNSILLSLDQLERAGLVKCGGSFVEITPPLFANHLVIQLLRGRRLEMFVLFGRLEEPGQARFLRRLSAIKSEEVGQFWDAMFAVDGPFGGWQTVRPHLPLLRTIAGAVPERVLQVLEQGLQSTTREEHLAIAGRQRRELIWILEELLFRLKTSRRAARLLWLLAEAENETCGNNATGVLTESFDPVHPQLPLPLSERVKLLREFLSEGVSEAGKFVVVRIVEGAARQSFTRLHRSNGPHLFGVRPTVTDKELRNYACSLVDVLFTLAYGEDAVARTALRVLPAVIEQLSRYAEPLDVLRYFRTLVDWVHAEKAGLEVPALSRELHSLRNRFTFYLEELPLAPERRKEFATYVMRVDQLQTELEATFAIRLKRWVGSQITEEAAELGANGHSPFEEPLKQLAEQVKIDPSLLSANLVEWLLSAAAERAEQFFFFLGKYEGRSAVSEIIEEIGQKQDGANLFAAYWKGWGEIDYSEASRRLDELTTMNLVTGDAIVFATTYLGASPQAVERVKAQIQAKRIAPASVRAALLVGQWVKQLTEEQFGQLLKHITGENFEYASVAIDLLSSWVHNERPLRGDLAHFAWVCLEHDPPVKLPAQEWDFDLLAAKLAEGDLSRGFRLLTQLLHRKERIEGFELDYWHPLHQRGMSRFWNVLYTEDRERLLLLLLEVSRANPLQGFYLSWRVRKLINQDKDKELLLSFATCGVENARILASWITSAKPGFWPIVFAFVRMYPDDEQMLNNLTSGIEQEGVIRQGSRSRFYEGRKQEIEQILNDPTTPGEVQAWLHEVLSRMEREIPLQLVWEYDMDVDELRHQAQDKDSPQRLWAIGRILKYAQWEDIKRLLTVEDIAEALSQIDLPDKRRRMFERAVKVWQHG